MKESIITIKEIPTEEIADTVLMYEDLMKTFTLRNKATYDIKADYLNNNIVVTIQEDADTATRNKEDITISCN
jgi:hypothetical protein